MEPLRFEILDTPSPINGQLRYVSEDYAFDFRMDSSQEARRGNGGATSFAVDTLQLEVAIDTSLCLYIWGYCPMGKWQCASLLPPTARRGSLQAIYDKPLTPGVSIGLENMLPAHAWFDPDSGWFCMGNKDVPASAEPVEFATNCVAVVMDRGLSSLWIRPDNWIEVACEFVKPR